MKGSTIFSRLLVGCLFLGGCVWFFVWKNLGAPLAEEFEFTRSDALDFASRHSQSDCVSEALSRMAHCRGAWCEVHAYTFTRTCVHKAQESHGLCASLPDRSTPISEWPEIPCPDIPANPGACAQVLLAAAEACAARE